MARESQLWDWFDGGVKKTFPVGSNNFRIDRIESPITPGFPDTSYTFNGVSGHIEMKSVPEIPKRERTRVFGPEKGLSTDQLNWHFREAAAGGIHFILARAGEYKWLIEGRHHDKFNDMSVRDLGVHSVYWKSTAWSKNDWVLFFTALRLRPGLK